MMAMQTEKGWHDLIQLAGGSYSRGPLCLAEEGSPESSVTSQKAAEGTRMHQVGHCVYFLVDVLLWYHQHSQ